VGKSCLRSGDQAQRLGCVDEVPLRRFPRVNPVLRFKAHGSGKDNTSFLNSVTLSFRTLRRL
jgi:hypothetical protein